MKFYFLKKNKRNRETDRDEFIFYSKRLMRILIEYALSLLSFEVIIFQFSIINIQMISSRMLQLKHHKDFNIKEKNMSIPM